MKSKIIQFILVVLLAISVNAQPPNNTIFFGSTGDGFSKNQNASASHAIFVGGTGDGFNRAANISTSNNIFVGGFGDGWNTSTNTSTSNAIFLGGVGDGWNTAANTSVSNTIFIGGIGDGWNVAANSSVSNTIFVGGIGDGWNRTANVSVSNSIFSGGVGDGWASTYRPMGGLPVTFLYFIAQKQGATVALLSWKTAQESNSSHYDVERSNDGVNFYYIGKVNANGNTSAESKYSFTDNAPAKGFNYYRLKQVDRDGRFIYTVARVLNFDILDAGMVKYYPNPTIGILNIELTDEMKAGNKWITISNTAGIVVDQVKLSQNNNSIIRVNLRKYPKGIYFIHVKTTSCSSTQRVVLQ